MKKKTRIQRYDNKRQTGREVGMTEMWGLLSIQCYSSTESPSSSKGKFQWFPQSFYRDSGCDLFSSCTRFLDVLFESILSPFFTGSFPKIGKALYFSNVWNAWETEITLNPWGIKISSTRLKRLLCNMPTSSLKGPKKYLGRHCCWKMPSRLLPQQRERTSSPCHSYSLYKIKLPSAP